MLAPDLRNHIFLGNFSDEEREIILRSGKLINSPRALQFSTKDLHFILNGFVAITNEQNTYIQDILGVDGVIGNTKLTEPSTFTTIRMLTTAQFLYVPHEVYLTMLQNKSFVEKLIQRLSENQERSNRRLYLHTEDSSTKIWEALILLFKDYGVIQKNEMILPFRLINKDLANYCGTTRETVNRCLKQFVQEKRIEMISKRGNYANSKLILLNHELLKAA